MTIKEIAPEIDRLVWAVGDRLREKRSNNELPLCDVLPPPVFGTLINIGAYLEGISESFIRRRYIYRPPAVISDFLASMEQGGFLTRGDDDPDRLVPTAALTPLREEIDNVTREISEGLWSNHESTVVAANGIARQVLEASPVVEGLAQAAIAVSEPDHQYHRFFLNLAGLRLLRNEAHVTAWRAMGLSPSDVEVLTDAWAGTKLQGPLVISELLKERGYAEGGEVTDAGLAARAEIEEKTNAGVASAFSEADQDEFLRLLRQLPS